MRKRLISLNLAILMMLSSVLPVFAVETDNTVEPMSEETGFTITYDGNGCVTENSEGSLVHTVGDGITQVPAAENTFLPPEDKYFLGWSIDADGNDKWFFPSDSITLENNITLYAQWGYAGALRHWLDEAGNDRITAYKGYIWSPFRYQSAPEGKILVGWNTEEDGTGTWIGRFERFPYITGQVIHLYAQYESLTKYEFYYLLEFDKFADGKQIHIMPMESNEEEITFPEFDSLIGEVEDYYLPYFWTTDLKYGVEGYVEDAANIFFPGDTTVVKSGQTYQASTTYNTDTAIRAAKYNGNGATTDSGKTQKVHYATTELNLQLYSGEDVFENTLEGKSFYEWNTKADGSGDSYSVGETLWIGFYNLYAQWRSEDEGYIYYHGVDGTTENGESSVKQQIILNQSTVIKNNVFVTSSDGEPFLAWNTEKKGNGTWYFPGDEVVFGSDVDLYAQWGENAIVFHWTDVNGKSRINSRFNRTSVYYGFSSEPEGKSFINWNTSADGTGTTYNQYDPIELPLGTVLHVYAQYQDVNGLYIRYDGNGQLTPEGAALVLEDGYTPGQAVTLKSDLFTPPDGEVLLGWEDNKGNWYNVNDSIILDKSKILTAQWGESAVIYHWTDKYGDSQVDIDINTSFVYCYCSSEPSGKALLHWNTNVDGTGTSYNQNEYVDLPLGTVLHVYAQYRDVDGLYIRYDGDGQLTPEGATIVLEDGYAQGQTVTLRSDLFTPPDGEVLLGWEDDWGNWYNVGDSIILENSTTVTAQWGEAVIFYHWTNASGYTRINRRFNQSSIYYNVSSEPTGKTFINWNTSADGTGTTYNQYDPVELPLGTVLHVYAQYQDVNGLYIRYDSDGQMTSEGAAFVLEDGYTQGQSVTLKSDLFTPPDGEVLLGWKDNKGSWYNVNDSIILDKSKILTAQWGRNAIIYHWTDEYGDSQVDTDINTSYVYGYCSSDPLGTAFLYWNTNSDGTGTTYNQDDPIVLPFGTALHVYAQYQDVNGLYIRYDGKGQLTVNCDAVVVEDGFVPGQSVTLKSDLFTPPDGEMLLGWRDQHQNWYTAGENTTITSNMLLRAVYGKHCIVYHAKDLVGRPKTNIETDKDCSRALLCWLEAKYIPLGWNTKEDGTGTWIYGNEKLELADGQVLHLYGQYEQVPQTGYYYVLKSDKLSNGRCSTIIPLTSEEQEIVLPDLFTEDYPAYGWVPIKDYEKLFEYNHSCGSTEFVDPDTEIPAVLKPGTRYVVKSGEQLCALMNTEVCEVIYHGNGAATSNGETARKQIEVSTDFNLRIYNGSHIFETPEGKVFDSWNTNADGSGEKYTEDQRIWTGILNLFAQWGNRAVLTIGETEHGTISVNNTEVAVGSMVTILPNPTPGYRLSTVYVDGKPITGSSFEVTGDHTITADFAFYKPVRASGVWDDRINWCLYEDGELYLSGADGSIPDSFEDDMLLYQLRDQVTGIYIEYGITMLFPKSLSAFSNAEWVHIPDSLTSIDYQTFRKLPALERVFFHGSDEQWESQRFLHNNIVPESVLYYADTVDCDAGFLSAYPIGTTLDLSEGLLLTFSDGRTLAVDNTELSYDFSAVGDAEIVVDCLGFRFTFPVTVYEDYHAEVEFQDEHTAEIQFYGADAEYAVAAFYDKETGKMVKSEIVTVDSANETIIVTDPRINLSAYEIQVFALGENYNPLVKQFNLTQ